MSFVSFLGEEEVNCCKYFIVLIVYSLSGVAQAHHAFASHYNPRETMQLQGELVEFNLISPHSHAIIAVTAEDGSVQNWEIEGASPAHLRRMGVDENTFVPGDRITVVAWPNRNPNNPLAYGMGYVLANGERIGQLPDIRLDEYDQQRVGAASVVGRWQAPLPDYPNQQLMPLNEAGIAARDNYDPKNSPANECAPTSIPSSLYAPFLNDIQISEDEVVFFHEVFGTERRIPLNGPSAQVEETGVFGYASARIEGDSLIVESSNYPASGWGVAIANHAIGGYADIPSSEGKKLVERYWTSEDGLTLNLEYTLSDPGYLDGEYSAQIVWHRVADDEPIYDYSCVGESASRFTDGI